MADTMRVRITYSKEKWDVGKVRDLPADEAKTLIREGRAQAYDGPADEDGYASPVTGTVPPGQASHTVRAEASQTPAPTDQPAKTNPTRRRVDTPPAPTA